MNVKKSFSTMTTAVLLVAAMAVGGAAWTVDSAGLGFVGKGDVQLVYGWNNAQLQNNAGSVQFRASTVTETTWVCTNANNEHTQERERTTTTAGLVSKVDRVRNQITGFNLTGWTGATTSESEGPKLNSCPAAPSTWGLTTPAGDPVVVGGGLQVSINGTDWFTLP